jgi:PhzF family phenazine biosynthesis protein
MTLRNGLFCVDAFADRIGTGNPAGVCLLSEPADPGWMQTIAREVNLSKTAFVAQQENGFLLRCFTPSAEVDLCGHAALAAMHILLEKAYLGTGETARFFTKSGVLTARQTGNLIRMDFPAEPENEVPAPAALTEALGLQPCYTGRNRSDLLVEVSSEDVVRNLVYDFECLRHIPVRGVMVTSRASTPGFDFVSRFFAPSAGINEDPVTVSAHCCLGPFWQKRLKKDTLIAYQASERGGVIRLRLDLPGRVKIAGTAVTVWEGTMRT